MASSSQLLSSVSRCPVEIWCLILRYATRPSVGRREGHSRMEPAKLSGGLVIPARAWLKGERRASLDVMLSASLVCHMWKEMLIPLLLEWVTLWDEKSLLTLPRLFNQPFRDGLKGDWVRRLVINASFFPRSDSEAPGRHDPDTPSHQAMLQSLPACRRLEEVALFVDPQSAAVQGMLLKLLERCASTLKLVELQNFYTSSSAHVARLFIACPKIEHAEISIGRQAFEMLHSDTSLPRSHNLQSLVWWITTENASFLPFFATLDLPRLETLSIVADYEMDNDGHYELDSEVASVSLMQLLLSHGPKLLSLEVTDTTLPCIDATSDIQWSDVCPNLQDLTFDLVWTRLRTLHTPHTALRLVSLRGFFNRAFPYFDVDADVEEHIRDAISTIEVLCGQDFPNLEAIRCMDIQPSDNIYRTIRSTRGDFNDAFRLFAVKAANICGEKHVRFEDCLGQPMGLDFAPLSFLHYRDDWQILSAPNHRL